LLRDVESLESNVDRLQDLVGTGAYNPETARVLSFKDNPASLDLAIRTETLDGLRKENAALLEQVDKLRQSRVLEEKEVAEEQADSVPRATYDNALLEVQKHTEELAQAQKAKQRLTEAFRVKAQEMREAVSTLLGVCVIMLKVTIMLIMLYSTAWIFAMAVAFGLHPSLLTLALNI